MNAIEHIFSLEDSRSMNVMEKEYIRNQCIFVDSPVLDSFEVFGQSTPFASGKKQNVAMKRTGILIRILLGDCMGANGKSL